MATPKRNLSAFAGDYCVVDTETTGLAAGRDEIIEIGMVKVRGHEIAARYQQMIRPRRRIGSFITVLTGITDEMVRGMPGISDVGDEILGFIGTDVIVGHNTAFDIRFLEAGLCCALPNEYVDTMLLSRRVYPELRHHRLSDLTAYLGLAANAHRALADCLATKELYDAIRAKVLRENLGTGDMWIYRRY